MIVLPVSLDFCLWSFYFYMIIKALRHITSDLSLNHEDTLDEETRKEEEE